ncbi:MAG TPA: tetratricopeptide repeat protein [Thermoanaerobaculia bacterium]|nr:tetratricopeptide repeat protein [Thermoanaerobaculia bacterium]
MSYPGNPSLPAPVKDRVLSTFQQTLGLFKQGRTDEVAAGCNLLLQMDPMFDPAKKLLAKLRNPAMPLDVDSLLPEGPALNQRAPMELAREAMAARDFQRVIHITGEVLTDDLLNDEARILGDEAREKLEASPFVEQFARKAEKSLAGGNVAAAKMELEKARALDPAHPEVLRVAQAISARDSAPVRPVAPPPSFVVEEPKPAAGGRSAAQAADFGFTFEEEKPAEVSFSNFSFDTPAATDFSFDKPAPPAAPKQDSPFGGFSFDASPSAGPGSSSLGGAEFDFATASVATNDDDQRKIDQYLTDGDRAYDAGDYTQAIDLWSRIFLIDVTNDLASDRIERAKKKRREIEQKVEGILASGIEAFDRGDTAKAHAELSEVLRLDPRNISAQEYLDRLGETVPGSKPGAPSAYIPPSSDDTFGGDLFDDELAIGGGYETPLVPPDPDTIAAAAAEKAKAKTAPSPGTERKLPLKLIAIVLGVLVLAAGGWFAWSRMGSEPEATETSDQGAQLIARATTLAKNGQIDRAIALLRDIKPGDPKHNDALVLIADLQKKKSTSATLIDGIPAAEYYDQRIAAATAAFAAGDYVAAKAAFEQAKSVKPLPPDLEAQYAAATEQASKLDAAKTLFAEQRYAEAIASLQPLLAADPANVSIQRMIADARFNLSAVALQEERTADAIRELDEVLKVNPNDELARRSRELAVRYNNEPKDLLYRIYVKYLPLRAGT